MLTLKEFSVRPKKITAETPIHSQENQKIIRPRMSEGSKKPSIRNHLMTRDICNNQTDKKSHSDAKRRILTAGAKRRFPKDFFKLEESPLNLESVQFPAKINKMYNNELFIEVNPRKHLRTDPQQQDPTAQETPKFQRSPLREPEQETHENQFMIGGERKWQKNNLEINSYDMGGSRKPASFMKKAQKLRNLRQDKKWQRSSSQYSGLTLPHLFRK